MSRRAEFEFFDPTSAPRALLEAASVAFPTRQLAWLIRVRKDSKIGNYLALACKELLSSQEKIARVALGDGDSLHLGLLPAGASASKPSKSAAGASGASKKQKKSVA